MGRSLVSSTTLVQADVVDLFYDLIANDSVIKATEGVKVEKIVDRRALASTSEPGNKRIIISKPRCGPFQPNCGDISGQVAEYVKIETVVKTVEGQENAETVAKSLKSRMKDILFDAQFLGTGWLYHREVDDKFPSAPMETRAYHILVYEVLTTIGRKSES